jgi:hypothetical protein
VIDKLVSYLPWSKEKFRTNKVRLKSIEEISEILMLNKNSYDIQIKENSFIIWKFTIKWELYA